MCYNKPMKLDDNFDDDEFYNDNKNSNSYMMYTVAAVSLVFLFILVIVIAMNPQKKKTGSTTSYNYVPGTTDDTITVGDLQVDDLDFWHDYDDQVEPSAKPNSTATDTTVTEPSPEPSEVLDPSMDGKHTLITYKDGTEEWLEINPYLALNTYNDANFVYVNNLMKYYENGSNVSFSGVDLSKNNDYVDFDRLKNAGIDYVMLRLGTRGFISGEISIDENFQDNYDRATAAGLDVGVYFFSQAITKEEAIEEAEFVIASLSQNAISYPVAFYMEDVAGTDVRTNDLTQMARTNIAIAFMNAVKAAGYCPIICGNKEWLLKKVSFGSLIGYDVWLLQDADTPDFPYEYEMWRYNSFGEIPGVSGYANLCISFTDYTIR